MFHAGFLAIPEKRSEYVRPWCDGRLRLERDRQWGQLMDSSVEIEQCQADGVRPYYSAVGRQLPQLPGSGYISTTASAPRSRGEMGKLPRFGVVDEHQGRLRTRSSTNYTFSISGDMKLRIFRFRPMWL